MAFRIVSIEVGEAREEVTGGCRKLYNGETKDYHCSPNVTMVMKSRMMRWAEHVASMGER